jgi:hypothetical protein
LDEGRAQADIRHRQTSGSCRPEARVAIRALPSDPNVFQSYRLDGRLVFEAHFLLSEVMSRNVNRRAYRRNCTIRVFHVESFVTMPHYDLLTHLDWKVRSILIVSPYVEQEFFSRIVNKLKAYPVDSGDGHSEPSGHFGVR